MSHAHVTEQWRGQPARAVATATGVDGSGPMGTLLCVYDNVVAGLRDTIGCTPREPVNGPRHMRQILDSDTDGWVQVDLFLCDGRECGGAGNGYILGADVPPFVER